MRIVFAGTPDFAVPSLKALVAAAHDVSAVLTQPDRPAGRGRRTVAGPVKYCARRLNIDVLQPESLKDTSTLAELRRLSPQVLVVVAYGSLLKREVLRLPDHGCINIHASLLPRWRGAAPIQRAIEAGDSQTGITIMQMDEGLDTGPILARRTTPVIARDTAGTLNERLASLGAELLIETLKGLEQGTIEPTPQGEDQVTYAAKITPDDARADWHRSATHIERQVRAMNPWPIVRTTLDGQSMRIWEAQVVPDDGSGVPGEIVQVGSAGVDVACGHDILRISALQREGGKRLSAAEFLNGYPLEIGQNFVSWRG